MMRSRIGCCLLVELLLSSFATKRFQIDGYLNDVSPSGQYILYETPEDWEPGEYRLGNLCVLNVKTGGITIVQDHTLIDECKNFFLNESTVAMETGGGQVELYNIRAKALEKEPLLAGNEKGITLQFALSEDRSKAALILLDMNKKLKDNDNRHEPTYRVALRVVDFKSRKEYIDEHYDYIGGTDVHKGKILWHGDNNIIYAYQNSCYYYNLAQRKSFPLASNDTSIALHEDVLIFSGKKFDFSKQAITELPSQSQHSRLHTHSRQAFGRWYTTNIYGIHQAALRIDDNNQYYYYVMNANYELIPTDKLVLYQDKGLSIQLLLTKPHERYSLTREGLLISYDKD
jgi:hypothetical protein